MKRFLCRHVFLPTFEGLVKGRKTFRYWKELEATQWLGATRLEEIQFEALKRLVAHAFEHSAYYRDEWKRGGLQPNLLQTPADFRHWPIIDGQTILENRLRMRAALPGMRLIAHSTGGSSGVPLHFDLDTDSYARRTAAWHRGYSWEGAAPGTKQLYLWGVALGQRPQWRNWKDRLYNRLHRRLVLNSFEMSDERVPDFLRRLNAYRPEVVVAYTSPLYEFARELDARGLKPYQPKTIICGSEKLHSFQRSVIEKVFQAPVFETYGSREFRLIGAECDRREGFHLTMENLLVEVLDDAGRPTPRGEEGNVVVTDLHNYGMPFIRYFNGDRAVAGWEKCTCGRGLPLLKKVVGRRIDILETPDGRIIPGIFFPHLLKDYPAVKRFQVVQQALDSVQLRVVLKDGFEERSRGAIESEVKKVLGSAVRFEFLPVDDIPLSATGKLRVVVKADGCARPVRQLQSVP
jgi:phenylacetate-CoA ligase